MLGMENLHNMHTLPEPYYYFSKQQMWDTGVAESDCTYIIPLLHEQTQRHFEHTYFTPLV